MSSLLDRTQFLLFLRAKLLHLPSLPSSNDNSNSTSSMGCHHDTILSNGSRPGLVVATDGGQDPASTTTTTMTSGSLALRVAGTRQGRSSSSSLLHTSSSSHSNSRRVRCTPTRMQRAKPRPRSMACSTRTRTVLAAPVVAFPTLIRSTCRCGRTRCHRTHRPHSLLASPQAVAAPLVLRPSISSSLHSSLHTTTTTTTISSSSTSSTSSSNHRLA